MPSGNGEEKNLFFQGCWSLFIQKKKKKKKNDREGQLVSEIAIIPDWLSRDVQRYLLPG